MRNWRWDRMCTLSAGKGNDKLDRVLGKPVVLQVIFSDEKRFLVFGDKPLRCWRRQGQRLQGNFIRSQSQNKVGIMCWLALKKDGTSRLIRWPATVDSASYQTAMLALSLPFMRGSWFQQDNAPPHVSASTRA